MSESVFSVALIGCGDIAATGHAPALAAHPRFRLKALCDVDEARARALADRVPDAEITTDYRALLDRGDIQAVILALHPEVSVQVALDFLGAGKAVLDEKPLAANLSDGRRILSALSESPGVYQAGFSFRYAPPIHRIAEASRRIGLPALFHFTVYDEKLDRKNHEHFNRMQHILTASSAIVHEASHVLDYFSFWDDSGFRTASAHALSTQPDFKGPNLWSARLTTGSGSALEIQIGWLLPELPPNALTICGPHGWLQLNRATGLGQMRLDGEEQRAIDFGKMSQQWISQLDAFAAAMDEGQATQATAEDGFRALAAGVACEESHRQGVTVAIEQPDCGAS